MSFIRKSNPYNPGYALPGSVLDEPRGRGTIVTRYAPRKTISQYRPQNSGGYAVPQSVKDEPPGLGVRVTKQRKRGTIFGRLQSQVGVGRKVGQVAVGGIFSDNTLDGNVFDRKIEGFGSLGCGGTGCTCRSPVGLGAVATGLPLLPEALLKEILPKGSVSNATYVRSLQTRMNAFITTIPKQIPGLSMEESGVWHEKLHETVNGMNTSFVGTFVAMLFNGKLPIAKIKMASGAAGCLFYDYRAQKRIEGACPPSNRVFGVLKTIGGAIGRVLSKLTCELASTGVLQAGAGAAGASYGGPTGGAVGAQIGQVVAGKCVPIPPIVEEPVVGQDQNKFPVVPVAIGAGLLLILALR